MPNLLDAVRERHASGDARFFVVVPQTKPRHGNVIYDEAVRDSAQVRVDLALAFMREEGIEGSGEVGDADPFNAATDAVGAHRIDEIIVSTLPATSSSWLRRDLPERLEVQTGLPVEHLEQLAEEGPHRFIVVVPQDSGDGTAVRAARERLEQLLGSLHEDGIVAAGMIGDPDAYTAARNALEYFYISQIVVSTLPHNRSQWVEKGLIEKLERESGKSVLHVESSPERAEAGA